MHNSDEKQKPTIKLTEEQKAEIIEEIFDHGVATKEVVIIPNRIKIWFKSLTPTDYFKLEDKMAETKNPSKLGLLQSYGLSKLSFGITKYKTSKEYNFTDKPVEDIYEFFAKQPSAIVDRLLMEQQIFEAEIKQALEKENIENHFFAEGDSQLNPEQSPEA